MIATRHGTARAGAGSGRTGGTGRAGGGGGGEGAHTGRNTMEHFPLFTTLGVIDLLTSAGVRNTPSSTAVNNESYCESCVVRAPLVMCYVVCIVN